MPEWPEVRTHLSRMQFRPEREAEIIEELSQHLDERFEELRNKGATDAEARRLAAEELLAPDTLADHLRSLRQATVSPPVTPGEPGRFSLDGLRQDLRYAFRMLGRQPGFAATAIITLALGIGANSAIFALVDATLLRPLPFPQPDRLAMMWERTDKALQGPVAPLNMNDWAARSRTFERMGGFIPGIGGMVMTGADGAAETVSRQWVAPGIFAALDIRPVVGRTFLPSDEKGRTNVVVLSEAFWRARFGADRAIVGREIRLDGDQYTVLGVVPKEAQWIGQTSIWALLRLPPVPQLRSAYFLRVVGRMRRGVTIERARADMAAVADGLAREFPKTNSGHGVTLEPLHDAWIGSDLRLTSLLFLGVVGIVLLICCSNVANLLLARASVRARELAIRSTLGAHRPRIVRQLVIESLVLSAWGAALGAAVGFAILKLAPRIIPGGLLPGAVTLSFDLRVVAFCALTSVLTGIVFGLVPAWKATGVNTAEVIASVSRTSTSQGSRVRGLLVVAEISTAVLLLYGAGLLLRTLIAVDHVDRGYQAENVLTMMVDPLGSRYPTPEKLLQFFQQVESEIASIPGIRSIAWASSLPLQPTDDGLMPFDVVGAPQQPEGERPQADYQIVSPSYFQTISLPVTAGRAFNERDTLSSPQVCMVSEAFVRRYAQGRSPIGMRLSFQDPGSQAPANAREVVGVARQVKDRPDETQGMVRIYVPMAQRNSDDMYVLVRPVSQDAATLAPSVRAAIARIDKEQLVSVREISTLGGIASDATSRHRFRAVLVAALAGLALALAMVGVFGILAYSVQQRVREIGVRRALGATTAGLVGLILGSAGRLIGAGAFIGLTLAAIFGHLMATMLFGVEPLDPITLGGVMLLLVLAAAVAAAVPGWRAVHVEPARALRGE